ncbi:hydrogenase nickel incorporation protein HypA [Synoicihabitans lomoniglobus]|uniref:Hydrogenase nickel incorporation protein HypA n=1 Tax=Synoicihabitans lomoniglobus TaxID=2909285 RepID=A0AAF0CIP7_9BACT|nr:hydrogenase nickel incorporation protein HypA [Opitutaceae bacterium LMO-M01]WED65642.1 hydrogenase nickel incorporation protein HypA [Opitutaceae bacterium LMO-M01]
MFDLTTASVAFCLVTAAFFLGLWIYYDRRDHARFEAERRKTIFHCIRCDHVYPGRGKLHESLCPECGQKNGRLRF